MVRRRRGWRPTDRPTDRRCRYGGPNKRTDAPVSTHTAAAAAAAARLYRKPANLAAPGVYENGKHSGPDGCGGAEAAVAAEAAEEEVAAERQWRRGMFIQRGRCVDTRCGRLIAARRRRMISHSAAPGTPQRAIYRPGLRTTELPLDVGGMTGTAEIRRLDLREPQVTDGVGGGVLPRPDKAAVCQERAPRGTTFTPRSPVTRHRHPSQPSRTVTRDRARRGAAERALTPPPEGVMQISDR